MRCGVVRITIGNLHPNIKYLRLQCEYETMSGNTQHSVIIIPSDRFARFKMGQRLDRSTCGANWFFLRAPFHLRAHTLSLRLSASSPDGLRWMNPYPTQNIEIPSMHWSPESHIAEFYRRRGGPRRLRALRLQGFDEKDSPSCKSMLYLTENDLLVVEDLLVRRRDQQSFDTFFAIQHSLRDNWNIIEMCSQFFQSLLEPNRIRAFAYLYLNPMTQLFALQIMSFLFPPKWDDVVHCFGGRLHTVNMLVHRPGFDFWRRFDVTEEMRCDVCRVAFGKWPYMYHSGAEEQDDVHHFCMDCVCEVMLLREKLKSVLLELNTNLGNDCIDEIVRYLI